jgi:hypothetical protein
MRRSCGFGGRYGQGLSISQCSEGGRASLTGLGCEVQNPGARTCRLSAWDV